MLNNENESKSNILCKTGRNNSIVIEQYNQHQQPIMLTNSNFIQSSSCATTATTNSLTNTLVSSTISPSLTNMNMNYSSAISLTANAPPLPPRHNYNSNRMIIQQQHRPSMKYFSSQSTLLNQCNINDQGSSTNSLKSNIFECLLNNNNNCNSDNNEENKFMSKMNQSTNSGSLLLNSDLNSDGKYGSISIPNVSSHNTTSSITSANFYHKPLERTIASNGTVSPCSSPKSSHEMTNVQEYTSPLLTKRNTLLSSHLVSSFSEFSLPINKSTITENISDGDLLDEQNNICKDKLNQSEKLIGENSSLSLAQENTNSANENNVDQIITDVNQPETSQLLKNRKNDNVTAPNVGKILNADKQSSCGDDGDDEASLMTGVNSAVSSSQTSILSSGSSEESFGEILCNKSSQCKAFPTLASTSESNIQIRFHNSKGNKLDTRNARQITENEIRNAGNMISGEIISQHDVKNVTTSDNNEHCDNNSLFTSDINTNNTLSNLISQFETVLNASTLLDERETTTVTTISSTITTNTTPFVVSEEGTVPKTICDQTLSNVNELSHSNDNETNYYHHNLDDIEEDDSNDDDNSVLIQNEEYSDDLASRNYLTAVRENHNHSSSSNISRNDDSDCDDEDGADADFELESADEEDEENGHCQSEGSAAAIAASNSHRRLERVDAFAIQSNIIPLLDLNKNANSSNMGSTSTTSVISNSKILSPPTSTNTELNDLNISPNHRHINDTHRKPQTMVLGNLVIVNIKIVI